MSPKGVSSILVAEDDVEDCKLLESALRETGSPQLMSFVHDGEELLSYLRREGAFADESNFPMPELILLDWNMPKMSGREALQEIKSDPQLRDIPVILLTTSCAEENIKRAYELGANSYVQKPTRFQDLVALMHSLVHYWSRTVVLPERVKS